MRSKLEVFCKKHARSLIFWGAFIVFVTFIVKEGFRERWEQRASTIDLAQYFYGIREATGSVANVQKERQLEQLPGRSHQFSYSRELQEKVDRLDAVQIKLENLHILAETVPTHNSEREALEGELPSLRSRLDDLRTQERSLADIAASAWVGSEKVAAYVEKVGDATDEVIHLQF